MTEYKNPDPRVRDAPNFDPRTNDVDARAADYDDRYAAEGGSPPWGWIAGAVFAFLVLAVIFSWGGNDRTAARIPANPPASTTGTAPPASPVPPAPRAPTGTQ